MKIERIGLMAALVLGGAGMLTMSAPVARANQPHMEAALSALQTAESELAAADEDKGGHRVAALRDTRAAISEIRAGMRFANHH